MNPTQYGGGGAVAGMLAIALGILFPHWTADQYGAVAGLAVMAIAAIHTFVVWFIKWKWPGVPPVP
jgi:hypothetical protein